ncbi:hypothetical protein [Oceanivirga miroungae]|uniref:Uncharacterized protein n=1 Tax=Oceanivirga miroungae TaxID=1130046 RepID=A0A6I8MCV8_9FUSO|nr:hypothetical protein [Oceanivirga miroungae]VWL85322.1 hypothetical protein OMES3154_00606 [Oceanivirga miroungae]
MFTEKYFKEDIKIFERSLDNKIDEGLKKIEENILGINDKSPKIYTVLLNKNKFNYEYILSAIVNDDVNSIYDTYLDSVYINAEYFKLSNYENKIFSGYFLVDSDKYEFRYVLEKDTRYFDKINEIYHIYLTNNVKWYGIDMKYINRMYRVKVVEYVDNIHLLENIDKFNIEYNFSSDVDLNLKPYWNILNKNFIAKESMSILDGFSYKYEIEKNENTFYLVNEKDEIIEDVVNQKNKLEIYSKFSNLYSFIILVIGYVNMSVFKYISVNYEYEIDSEPTIENIKRYFKKHDYEVVDIKMSNENKNYLDIPEYNKMIMKKYISNIEVKLDNYYDYDKIFKIVNILNLNLYMYKVVVYE